MLTSTYSGVLFGLGMMIPETLLAEGDEKYYQLNSQTYVPRMMLHISRVKILSAQHLTTWAYTVLHLILLYTPKRPSRLYLVRVTSTPLTLHVSDAAGRDL